jgi:hypothetical protein
MSTKLTDSFDGTKIVKKYLKAIKNNDWKVADRLAKLFPYLLTKPNKVDEPKDNGFHGIIIKDWANPACDACTKLAVEKAAKTNN